MKLEELFSKFRHSKLWLIGLSFVFVVGCSDDDEPEIVEEEQYIDIYTPDDAFKIVGYLPYYRFSQVNNIDFAKMNYVNIAFGNLDASGNIIIGNNVQIQSIVQQIKNANCKVLLSLGGGALSANQISNWVNLLSVDKRKNTVIKIVKYVETNNLDGIDVDIENNLIPALGNNFITGNTIFDRGGS